jgi:tetratricopeptide (TPR) repeat protein
MTGPYTPNLDETYRRYVDLLLQHHRLLSEGREEEAETEAIEEEMSCLWDRLDDAQRKSLSGLSSDLNWVRRRCQLAPQGRRSEEVTLQELQALVRFRDEADWHGLLHGLRACAPRMRPFQIASLRASAWEAIGFPKVVSTFYDVAFDLEPSNGSIAILALLAADRADPAEAIEKAARITDDPFRHPAVSVALATAMQIRDAETKGTPLDRPRFAELLRECLGRLRLEPASQGEIAMTYQLAASGFESLDELDDALKCYEEGLKLAPDNETLLIGLGLLVYGRDNERAEVAFTRAVQLDSPLVWPYFFLAHYHVLHEHFERALHFVLLALPKATSNPVRAELLEWFAICQSMLSYPDEAVLAMFREATVLDPANERIAKNLRAFEASRQDATHLKFDIETAQSLKVRRAREAWPSLGRLAA